MDSSPKLFYKKSAKHCVLQGAVLALALLSILFLTLGDSNSESLRWMILPYLLVPMAGGLGGLFFYKSQDLCFEGKNQKRINILLNLVIYLSLLTVAFVLGMNGPN